LTESRGTVNKAETRRRSTPSSEVLGRRGNRNIRIVGTKKTNARPDGMERDLGKNLDRGEGRGEAHDEVRYWNHHALNNRGKERDMGEGKSPIKTTG